MSKILSFPFLSLCLVLLLATLLRFAKLDTLPQAFFTDEAALVYNAWSLLTTLSDEYGEFLPLTLRSFDDYKPAIYSYLTIPVVWLFGLTQASSRAVAAAAGILAVWAIFQLLQRLGQNNRSSLWALLAALVLATAPWHIEVSRTAIEAGVAMSLTLTSLAIYRRDRLTLEIASFALLVLSLWTYHSARLVAPVLWLAAMMFAAIRVSRPFKIAVMVLFIAGLVLSLTASQSRFGQISIFKDQGVTLLREEAIREDGGPIHVSLLETRIFHNRPASWLYSFATSYITNTSLEYLFLGGAQPPRATIPATGQFLLLTLPFFIWGVVSAIQNLTKPTYKWLLFWLLWASVPAALTSAEIPNTYRTIYLLPVVAILIGLGLKSFIIWARTKMGRLAILYLIAVAAFLIWDFSRAWHQYRVHQQVHQPWYRQYGYRELFTFLATLDESSQIIITNRENEPYMMYLFYNQIDPAVYQAQPNKRLGHLEIETGATTWSLFNLTFTESACPHDVNDVDASHYYVVTAQCELPTGFARIKTVNFLDGNPEFHVDRPLTAQERKL